MFLKLCYPVLRSLSLPAYIRLCPSPETVQTLGPELLQPHVFLAQLVEIEVSVAEQRQGLAANQ